MNTRKKHSKKWYSLLLLGMVFLLSGCDQMVVFDPAGPVAEKQRDLIVYSLYFMGAVCLMVWIPFTIFLFKYRKNKKNRSEDDYEPDMHGNKLIETIWTVIPIIIVTALAIPTVTTLFDLEEPPKSSSDKEPLVIHATTSNWKWFFSYPEQGIETVNYLHIPTDRAVEFRLQSAGSMTALWIPALGGQMYNMAGMRNILYLQADEPGVYDGMNSNFNGVGFTEQTFNVYAEDSEKFQEWVNTKQQNAPKLTQEKYDELLAPSIVGRHTFSSTHLQWVDHGTMAGMDYAIKRYGSDYYDGKTHLKNSEKHREKLHDEWEQ
ncbi:cytochrome aa3 quinol oxidase subunit II [Virgibacillus ihumii]|uniref:cytochrome aa3 quinol oxidase subunit II n=1 Tax=Virgibacillus ihumii TaxID=2686091 RepID=UPI00157BFAAF|nr:cytochrome aa3 quinol oxidase subunit II [Virgibacillus ihumii]